MAEFTIWSKTGQSQKPVKVDNSRQWTMRIYKKRNFSDPLSYVSRLNRSWSLPIKARLSTKVLLYNQIL